MTVYPGGLVTHTIPQGAIAGYGIERAYDETKHPRGKGAQGGQFVAKGQSQNSDTVGFDAKKGSGAGYGKAGGDARVKSLQQYLNTLGFTDAQGKPLKVDGKLGPKTTAAIKRLQRRLGLKADGLVTPGLMNRLHRAAGRKERGNYGKQTKADAAKHAPKKVTGTGRRPRTGSGAVPRKTTNLKGSQ
jgi:peptidoglycan hydrolase-like protein with peptidoglycan-binding domain